MDIDGLEALGPRPQRIALEDLEIYERHGGHTLEKHVYTKPGDEVVRIRRDGVAAAGRFLNRATAQRCVDVAITRRTGDIIAWRSGRQRALPFTFGEDMGEVIGNTLTYADLKHGIRTPAQVTAVRLVLRQDLDLAAGFTVVTAYPTRPFRRERLPQEATA
jgi:hypothetical protein